MERESEGRREGGKVGMELGREGGMEEGELCSLKIMGRGLTYDLGIVNS